MLNRNNTPFLARRATVDSEGAPLHTVVLATPGSGQVFELHAPACASCGAGGTGLGADLGAKPFDPATECPQLHRLRRPLRHYAAAWACAAAPPSFSRLANELPAPMVTWVSVALDAVGDAVRFVRRLRR